MRFDKYHRIILQLLVICMLVTPLYCPVSAEAAAAASASSVEADNTVPGAVTLTTATSSAYNKITVRWRRTSGATQYLVYYKKADAPKWIKLASVPASQLEYTHISTKAFPIYVGRDYLYTVKAYNEKTRKAGAYNRKGLTARTYPNKVTLKDAVYNSAGTAVTVSWGKAPGGHYFRVYRKTDSSPGWKRIGIVPADQYSFVDKNPVKGEKNVYTVHAYNKNSKVYGKYDAAGVTARTRQDAETERVANLLKKTQTAKKTSQIILVVDHNLSFWEKNGAGNWIRKLSVYCGYGSNGLNDDRHEGDRTTPIGSFPILHGFGTADNPGSTLQYRKVTRNSYWSGEYSTYNTWVESARPIGGEHLIDYYQYKYAMAIGFNRNPTVYKKGSAIFLHCKSYDHWSTAGCVSVEESVMKKLLQMSRNGVYMIIVKSQSDITAY